MRHLPAIAALSLSLIAVNVCAQMAPLPPLWKWLDASGQVQFSDLPPPLSVANKDILERPTLQQQRAAAAAALAAAGASAPTSIGQARTDPELEARRKRAADEQAAQQRQLLDRDNVVRADNCNRARAHLAALNDGLRMTRTNAQGEREVLDDKARAEEMQRARGVLSSDCR